MRDICPKCLCLAHLGTDMSRVCLYVCTNLKLACSNCKTHKSSCSFYCPIFTALAEYATLFRDSPPNFPVAHHMCFMCLGVILGDDCVHLLYQFLDIHTCRKTYANGSHK